jgi:hypothetical protein
MMKSGTITCSIDLPCVADAHVRFRQTYSSKVLAECSDGQGRITHRLPPTGIMLGGIGQHCFVGSPVMDEISLTIAFEVLRTQPIRHPGVKGLEVRSRSAKMRLPAMSCWIRTQLKRRPQECPVLCRRPVRRVGTE